MCQVHSLLRRSHSQHLSAPTRLCNSSRDRPETSTNLHPHSPCLLNSVSESKLGVTYLHNNDSSSKPFLVLNKGSPLHSGIHPTRSPSQTSPCPGGVLHTGLELPSHLGGETGGTLLTGTSQTQRVLYRTLHGDWTDLRETFSQSEGGVHRTGVL